MCEEVESPESNEPLSLPTGPGSIFQPDGLMERGWCRKGQRSYDRNDSIHPGGAPKFSRFIKLLSRDSGNSIQYYSSGRKDSHLSILSVVWGNGSQLGSWETL